ncbi:hypothetical protein [Amedibacillus sp. YH-ame10]
MLNEHVYATMQVLIFTTILLLILWQTPSFKQMIIAMLTTCSNALWMIVLGYLADANIIPGIGASFYITICNGILFLIIIIRLMRASKKQR